MPRCSCSFFLYSFSSSSFLCLVLFECLQLRCYGREECFRNASVLSNCPLANDSQSCSQVKMKERGTKQQKGERVEKENELENEGEERSRKGEYRKRKRRGVRRVA